MLLEDTLGKASNSIDKHVGARVRMQRLILGWSQRDLGEAVGVTFQQVQKYEKGANKIGASRLQQIASALEVAPAYFFEGAPSDNISQANRTKEIIDISAFIYNQEGLTLARAFEKIPDLLLRRKILDMIKEIAKKYS